MFVGVVAVKANTAAAASCTITTTLRQGSKGAEVKCLQAALGLTADGSFGPKTKAAVVAWQKTANLTADGIFGAKSRAAWMGSSTTYPAGCTSSTGYSSTTGLPCSGSTTTTYPVGCASASGYSSVTGLPCTGTVTNQNGPVTASLSPSSPNGVYVIANQATADIADFVFSGNGTVNSVTLQRTGISDQNTFANVYLYNGNTRLTDGYSFNNSSTLTMNNLGLMVNGTMTISVKADLSSTAASSSTIGVTLTGMTVGTTAQTVSIPGYMLFLGGATNTASVYIDPANQSIVSGTVNAGTTAYTFWSDNIQVNQREVLLKGANFRIVGSAPSNALANIKLYVDGVAIGNPAVMTSITGSSYATFDFSGSPVSLTTGSHTIDVRADINGGSSYTIQMSLQQAADLVIVDPQLNINIAAAKNNTTAFASVNAGTITISGGSASVVIDPTFSAMTNITGGSTNTDIAKFKVHGYSEDVKVSSLSVTPVLSGSMNPAAAGLQNVAIFFNGSQVGSSQNWTSGALPFNLGSQMIIPAGTDNTIEVRADIQNNSSVSYTAGNVAATLNFLASNAQGQTSHTTLNFPGSTVVGNTLAIQTGLLAVSKNSAYTNQVVNPNTAGVVLGSFVLQNQSSSESVHVTKLGVALAFAVPTYSSGFTTTPGSQTWTVADANTTTATAGLTVGNVLTTVCTAGSPVMTVTSVASTTVTGTVVINGATACTGGSAITGSGTTSLATLTNFSNLRTTETSGSGANPIQPTGNDSFSVDFLLAPGATKTINVVADTSTANMGAAIASLTTTATGMSSHVTVYQNGGTTEVPVAGQTLTLGSGTLSTPTVVSSNTTQAQYIAGGTTTGITDATKVDFNVTAVNGNATITELKFKNTGTSGTVTGVRVGAVSAPTVGDIAYLTGVNLQISNGGAGADIVAYASYAPVGTTGVTSGGTASIALCSIKYTIGGTTTTVGDPTCLSSTSTTLLDSTHILTSNQTMTLVGSKPIVTVAQPAGVVLTASGSVEAIDVTIAADAAGPIKVNSFSINSTLSPSTALFGISASNPVIVKDANNNPVTLAGASCASTATNINCFFANTGGTVQVLLGSPYLINAGQSQTFKIFLPTGANTTTGTLPNSFMYTNIAVDTTSVSTSNVYFSWFDTAGSNATAIAGTANIYNFPNTFTSSIHN